MPMRPFDSGRVRSQAIVSAPSAALVAKRIELAFGIAAARAHPESPRCIRGAQTKPDARRRPWMQYRVRRAGASGEWAMGRAAQGSSDRKPVQRRRACGADAALQAYAAAAIDPFTASSWRARVRKAIHFFERCGQPCGCLFQPARAFFRGCRARIAHHAARQQCPW